MRPIVSMLAGVLLLSGSLGANAALVAARAAVTATPKDTPTFLSSSRKVFDGCYEGGQCDCDDLDGERGEYFKCITSRDYRPNLLTQTLSTSSRTSTSISHDESTITPSTTSRAKPPDNCWIGGPCDCSKHDENTDPWFNCITNPQCEHCFVNGSTLTPLPTTMLSTTLAMNSSSSGGGEITTNSKTLPPTNSRLPRVGGLLL